MTDAHAHPKETPAVDDDAITLARRLRTLEAVVKAAVPRWDADPLAIANGWVDGRCGKCGEPLPEPVSAPVSTEDTDLREQVARAMRLRFESDAIREEMVVDYTAFADAALSVLHPRFDAKDGWIALNRHRWDEARTEAAKWRETYDLQTQALRRAVDAVTNLVRATTDRWDDAANADGQVFDAIAKILADRAEVERLRGVVRDHHAQALATAEQLGRESDRRADEEDAAPVSSVEPERRAVVERLGVKAVIPKHLRAKPPKAKRKPPAVPVQAQPRVWKRGDPEPNANRVRANNGIVFSSCGLGDKPWFATYESGGDGRWYSWWDLVNPNTGPTPLTEVVEAPAGQAGAS